MDYMNYKTIQVIKKSERAEVLFASVEGLERPVVVKRLMEANPEVYRVVAGTQSLHLPEIYQIEARGDVLYVVEEYVDGRMLGAYLEEEALSDEKKLELMLQLCDAVELLHRCIPPVIHRDIKPSNILITPDGVLKLIDFDAARQYKVEKNTSDTRLLGTIEYAAPEQFGYSQTDLRSDIYSVGVVFSEIKIDKKASFARDWKRIVDRCTNFDPENRYKNVAELKKDLLKCIRRRKNGKKYAGIAAAGVAVLLFIGAGLLLSRNKEPETVNSVPTIAATPSSALVTEATDVPEFTPSETPALVQEQPEIKNIQKLPSEKKAKRTFGERAGWEGYSIKGMDYVESEAVSYKMYEGGLLSVQFEKNNGRIVFEPPVLADMNYCVDVVIKIGVQAGDMSLVLYDEAGTAVEVFDIEKTEEANEQFFTPMYKGKVAYVGLMVNDATPEDFSAFTALFYYVDFLFINPDTTKISYTMAELAEEDYYDCEYTCNEDGSVSIEYEELHGKLKLRFPEEVDMRYCIGIGIVMKSEEGMLEVNTYNSKFDWMDSIPGRKTNGIQEKLLRPNYKVAVGGIGLGLTGPEAEDFSGCTAIVYAINFYMEDDYLERLSEQAASVMPGNQKKLVGKQAELAKYVISDMEYADSHDLSYHLNDDGSVRLQFTGIYDSIRYELPDMIDMRYCEKLSVKMDIQKGEVAVILYDETGVDVESFYPPYGMVEEDGLTFSWSPRFTGKAARIGFMANEGELEDYSDFDTTVYSVTFYMEEPEAQ